VPCGGVGHVPDKFPALLYVALNFAIVLITAAERVLPMRFLEMDF
jgi:hypothetical protein